MQLYVWNFIKMLVASGMCTVRCVCKLAVSDVYVCMCMWNAQIDFEMVKETIFNGTKQHTYHTHSLTHSLSISGSGYLTSYNNVLTEHCNKKFLCVCIMGALPRRKESTEKGRRKKRDSNCSCSNLIHITCVVGIIQFQYSHFTDK